MQNLTEILNCLKQTEKNDKVINISGRLEFYKLWIIYPFLSPVKTVPCYCLVNKLTKDVMAGF